MTGSHCKSGIIEAVFQSDHVTDGLALITVNCVYHTQMVVTGSNTSPPVFDLSTSWMTIGRRKYHRAHTDRLFVKYLHGWISAWLWRLKCLRFLMEMPYHSNMLPISWKSVHYPFFIYCIVYIKRQKSVFSGAFVNSSLIGWDQSQVACQAGEKNIYFCNDALNPVASRCVVWINSNSDHYVANYECWTHSHAMINAFNCITGLVQH